MAIVYNDLLRAIHGRIALRVVDYPARTLAISPWYNEMPIGPLLVPRVPRQRVDPLTAGLQAAHSGSYEGVGGRGPVSVTRQADATGTAWYGPGVMT